MSWQDIGEFIKAGSALVTALAACFAAYIATTGLEKWRKEIVGKRKADLAANALKAFYEAAEILRNARSPWIMNHERSKIEGIADEIASNPNFAPERRLLDKGDFFGSFRTLKHEFAAVFGVDAAKHFDNLWSIRLEINHAVNMMLSHPELRDDPRPDNKQVWDEVYKTAFRSIKEGEDIVLKKIEAEVSAVEKICRPAIDISAKAATE